MILVTKYLVNFIGKSAEGEEIILLSKAFVFARDRDAYFQTVDAEHLDCPTEAIRIDSINVSRFEKQAIPRRADGTFRRRSYREGGR